MGYLCATCGGVGGLFKTSHAHSDKDSCIAELKAERAKLRADLEAVKAAEGIAVEQHNLADAEARSLKLQYNELRLYAQRAAGQLREFLKLGMLAPESAAHVRAAYESVEFSAFGKETQRAIQNSGDSEKTK